MSERLREKAMHCKRALMAPEVPKGHGLLVEIN